MSSTAGRVVFGFHGPFVSSVWCVELGIGMLFFAAFVSIVILFKPSFI